MSTNLNMHSTLLSLRSTSLGTSIGIPVPLSGSDAHTKNLFQLFLSMKKFLLSVVEAAAYFGIGQNRISELALQDGCKFVVFVGNKKLIKRRKFEEFLDEAIRHLTPYNVL